MGAFDPMLQMDIPVSDTSTEHPSDAGNIDDVGRATDMETSADPLIVGIMDGIHNSVLRLFLMIFCFLKYWRSLLLNHFSIQITRLVQDPNSRVKVAGVHFTRLISAQLVTEANSQEFLSALCYQRKTFPCTYIFHAT